ncbi:MAG: hypothetical protein AAGF60_00330 [Pseudomonadota bacterium]
MWQITWRLPILAPFAVAWYALWLMLPALPASVPFIVTLESSTGARSSWIAIAACIVIGPIWLRAVAWFFPAYMAIARLWLTGKSPHIQKKLADARLNEGR